MSNRPTLDDLAEIYDNAYDSVPEVKGYTNLNHCLGMQALVDNSWDMALSQAISMVEQFADDHKSSLEVLRMFREEGVVFR